jgi:hypothetical protein
VDLSNEMANLITAQRAYEMNSKVIQAADEMASVLAESGVGGAVRTRRSPRLGTRQVRCG